MEEQKEAELSVTGVWIVGAVPEQEVRNLLSASVQNSAQAPVHFDVPGELAWWRSKAQASMFTPSRSSPGDWSADEDALRLSAFFDACHDDSDHAEELRDTVMDKFPPDVEEGLFVATARKADPFSALAYALGPDATLRLPGWFGDFLLDAEQVRAQLPAVEEALVLTRTPRRDAIERIHAWMTGLGDDPDHNADELLDGPLRVLRHAVSSGHGAAGQVRWY
ncbi:hypothetical protein EDD90_4250 [Streptomyces sp. Ag109_O5-1]|uniref:hypothetical protein n=1 Tax=Streptomyces sp. Ag109_O5-1 TaxID=1938851 RepID=UPI000F4DB714|nr:hypothetical protein [Streptomyces sp. Ag109_O5-1]RPE41170.1 hypothetical protein EDD90_4250 [Streptomyces sp. Ag109_O5-1]